MASRNSRPINRVNTTLKWYKQFTKQNKCRWKSWCHNSPDDPILASLCCSGFARGPGSAIGLVWIWTHWWRNQDYGIWTTELSITDLKGTRPQVLPGRLRDVKEEVEARALPHDEALGPHRGSWIQWNSSFNNIRSISKRGTFSRNHGFVLV